MPVVKKRSGQKSENVHHQVIDGYIYSTAEKLALGFLKEELVCTLLRVLKIK